MIPGLGFGEMILIFAVLLLFFGAKRLPEIASGMGRGIRDFKRSLNGLEEPPANNQITPPPISGSQQIAPTAEETTTKTPV